jgi:hypothetical protein
VLGSMLLVLWILFQLLKPSMLGKASAEKIFYSAG